MATRPVFIPTEEGPLLVRERHFDFPWSSGFAETQKKKNVRALHHAAHRAGIDGLLEISSKSDEELGRKLSAFSLKIDIDGEMLPLESVYQGSKFFRESGSFPEIMRLPPREAKRYIRENAKGDLVRFELFGKSFPLWPKNAFYDWLYIKSLVDHSDWIKSKVSYGAFTDIEFNPEKQVNCQARAFAEYLSLQHRSMLESAAADFDYFASLLSTI
jgi:hypothetical protein